MWKCVLIPFEANSGAPNAILNSLNLVVDFTTCIESSSVNSFDRFGGNALANASVSIRARRFFFENARRTFESVSPTKGLMAHKRLPK